MVSLLLIPNLLVLGLCRPLLGSRAQQIGLSILSLIIYTWVGGLSALLVMSSLVVLNFIFGKRLIATPNRIEFAGFILVNITILILFKGGLHTTTAPTWIMPVGLSFLMLQIITFLNDCYHKTISHIPIIPYLLHMLFFAKIFSGPIVQFSDFSTQLQAQSWQKFNLANFNKGLSLCIIGASKKVLLADSLHAYLQKADTLTTTWSAVEAWLLGLGHVLHIYFDFSGYMDMALGVALIFNIVLPPNFNSPLRSTTIQEFWRRWHMTLRRFWVTHIYIPLGGNQLSLAGTIGIIWLIFLLSGYWHGTSLQYILYGVTYALGYTIYILWSKMEIRLPSLVAWVLTLIVPILGTIFITTPSTNAAYTRIHSMVWGGIPTITQLLSNSHLWTMTIALLLLALLPHNSMTMTNTYRPSWGYMALLLALCSTTLLVHLYIHTQIPFVYFRY